MVFAKRRRESLIFVSWRSLRAEALEKLYPRVRQITKNFGKGTNSCKNELEALLTDVQIIFNLKRDLSPIYWGKTVVNYTESVINFSPQLKDVFTVSLPNSDSTLQRTFRLHLKDEIFLKAWYKRPFKWCSNYTSIMNGPSQQATECGKMKWNMSWAQLKTLEAMILEPRKAVGRLIKVIFYKSGIMTGLINGSAIQ